jgi:hypothetical protein
MLLEAAKAVVPVAAMRVARAIDFTVELNILKSFLSVWLREVSV